MVSVLAANLLPLLLVAAAIEDVLRLRISNGLTLLTAAAFLPMAVLTGMPWTMLAAHAATAAAVLAFGFALFSARLIGGGDAKLMAAAALWFGYPAVVPFIVLTALAGGALALCLAGRAAVLAIADRWGQPALPSLASHHRDVPYGWALAAGGVLSLPHSWWAMAAVPA